MTMTLEESNTALRTAVLERLAGTPADDPKMTGYKIDQGDPEPAESCCDGARMSSSTCHTTRPTGSLYWADAYNRLGRLHREKTAQYGGDADPFENVTASAKCGVEPWRRALCDLSDCVVRMQRYAHGQPVDYENALLDAANWALICLIKIEEEKRGRAAHA